MKRTPDLKDYHERYEVHRAREPGRNGIERPAAVESFLGLDRARLAALGYALDGASYLEDKFTGVVSIYRVCCVSDRQVHSELIDQIDERVAFRVLNAIRLPKAGNMALSIGGIQGDLDAMADLGGQL